MTQNNYIKISLIFITFLIIYVYVKSIFQIVSQHLNTDIMLTYLSGKMLNAHTSGYIFNAEYLSAHKMKHNILPNLSPPFSIMMIALVAKYISYKVFFILFSIFVLTINIFALIKLYLHFFAENGVYHRLTLYAFILANLLYWPTFMNTTFGQVALLFNALIIFSYIALQHKHHIRAGVYLAVAINIKLFFSIFFVYFLAVKNYRAFLALTIFSLLLSLIPLCIYGKSIYQGYWNTLNHIQWYGVNWNASWYGFFSRALGETSHKFHSALFFPKISRIIYNAIFIFYVFFIYYFSRTKANSSLSFAFTISSMLLISPLGWTYYFPILITALLININSIESHQHYLPLIFLLLFSVFLSALPFPIYRDGKTSALSLISRGNIFFISLLLFNTVNFFQLLFPSVRNKISIMTKKIKLFVICVCLFPSLIGMCGMISAISKNTSTNKDATSLAIAEDLLPSNAKQG